MNSLRLKLQAIREVEYAVTVGKDGLALDDDSYEGTTHAAHATYISMLAGKIGNQIGAGNLQVAAVHGVQRHILMYQQRTQLVNFIVSGAAPLGSVEQTIFKTLSNQK